MLDFFPSYIQSEAKDCGPSCLKIVAKHYKKDIDIESIRLLSETTRGGTSLTGLVKSAKAVGFRATAVKENFDTLKEDAPLPAIVHWNQDHFVVVYKITNRHVYLSDPELGKIKYTKEDFLTNWLDTQTPDQKKGGVLMLLEPDTDFLKKGDFAKVTKPSSEFLWKHLRKYKKPFFHISLFVLVISILELTFPYITQKIIDQGVRNNDVDFIYLAAVAYIAIFLGYKTANIIRNWVVIKLSMKFNIGLISDFIKKLTLLPISYYDSKLTGDVFQRISDHDSLEKFFTTNSIIALFAFLNILLFGGLFLWYDQGIFLVFLAGTIIHLSWTLLFFNKRKVLDFKYFSIKSKENAKVIELIHGMQDIKLNGYEEEKKQEWESIRTKLYKRDMESMKVEQFQLDGASFINEIKNIVIIVAASLLVVNNQMTFGTLVAISYVIGHLNSPIERLVTFLNNIQDVKLGLRRIMEIHSKQNESQKGTGSNSIKMDDIVFDNVSFRYTGTSTNVLDKVSFTIPKNKVTAIVGPSGSGKTTILKLLLKFYSPTEGGIQIGDTTLDNLDFEKWRGQCGVVMQEGHIFNDTIQDNILLAQKYDEKKLSLACQAANIRSFIEGLPLKYNTKIGSEGVDISTGQKQRILMARAIYKNPEFLLFDEATSALDAKNEKEISTNLQNIFFGKTVLLIAHRLSTVKNADQIIVLSNKGTIEEIGNHNELIDNKGYYYELIQNQLELDMVG